MGRADVGRSDGATLKYDYTSAGLNKKSRVEQPCIEKGGNWRDANSRCAHAKSKPY
jgi:hypothetical protein